MARPSADLDTLAEVRKVLALAERRGEDAAEALDRAGLLSYPARDSMVRALALRMSAQVLDELQVSQIAASLAERMPMTSLDTKRLCVAWLRLAAEPQKEER